MLLLKISTLIATLGVGKIPKAPGTFGSLLAVLVWWAIFPISMQNQIILISVFFVVGVLATHHYEKKSKRHDPKEVVVDELVGMWITLFGAAHSISIFLVGFILFRVFDIWKPFPINWVDRHVPGALGTILDDVLAGICAYFCLRWLIAEGSLFAILNF